MSWHNVYAIQRGIATGLRCRGAECLLVSYRSLALPAAMCLSIQLSGVDVSHSSFIYGHNALYNV